MKDKKTTLKKLGNRKDNAEENECDDKNAGDLFKMQFWKMPLYFDKWMENLSINLTKAEAEFLQEQIIENCKGSLLACVLEMGITEFLDCESFRDLGAIIDKFSEAVQQDYWLALAFSDFIYVIRTVYNIIISDGQNEAANDELERLKPELKELADIDVDAAKLQNLIKGELSLSELSDLLKTLPEADLSKLDNLMKQVTDLTGKGLPATNDMLSGLLPESATLSEAANHIKELLDNKNLPPELKQALLKSDDFHKTLKMLIHTDWTLSAEELTEKDAVLNLYKRMDEQIDRLKTLADNTAGQASAKLSTDLGQTKQNMNFMNEMNQMYNFTELPIRMNGQTTTGDLYVYSDKHRKRVSGGNGISCLLHLDMKSLGGMNIRIELNEGTVSTRFFLNDDSSGKLITDNLFELDSALTKQGFNPKSEVIKTTDKEEEKRLLSGEFNPINDFIPSEVESNNFSRYTFDMRA